MTVIFFTKYILKGIPMKHIMLSCLLLLSHSLSPSDSSTSSALLNKHIPDGLLVLGTTIAIKSAQEWVLTQCNLPAQGPLPDQALTYTSAGCATYGIYKFLGAWMMHERFQKDSYSRQEEYFSQPEEYFSRQCSEKRKIESMLDAAMISFTVSSVLFGANVFYRCAKKS